MKPADTRTLISALYVLTILFLGAIYFQGQIITEPDAISTLQNMNYSAIGSHSLSGLYSLQLSPQSVMITIASLTFFFGFAWLMYRSKS